jgi:hypothetical protein
MSEGLVLLASVKGRLQQGEFLMNALVSQVVIANPELLLPKKNAALRPTEMGQVPFLHVRVTATLDRSRSTTCRAF